MKEEIDNPYSFYIWYDSKYAYRRNLIQSYNLRNKSKELYEKSTNGVVPMKYLYYYNIEKEITDYLLYCFFDNIDDIIDETSYD